MAARRVYDTPELRCSILEFLDRTTLAGMLRLEKAVTASVAGMLYKEVPRYLVGKMSRSTPRRATYCDAVRVLDWSNPTPSLRFSSFRGNSKPTVRFDPQTFLARLQTWKKKYPQLHTVRFQYPDNVLDDAYIVHVRDDRCVVEIESRIEFPLHKRPVSLPDPRAFPKPPIHNSIEYRQTFILTPIANHGVQFEADEEETRRTQEWSRWLYENPEADCRITGIDYRGYVGSPAIRLSFNEIMSYLALRKSKGCLPLTLFHIATPMTPSQLRVLATSLEPHIRSLTFTGFDYRVFGDLQIAIDIFTSAFPLLQSLRIFFCGLGGHDLDSCIPLSGVPRLRQLVFCCLPDILTSTTARYIAGLGGRDCVYIQTGLAGSELAAFHQSVKDARKRL